MVTPLAEVFSATVSTFISDIMRSPKLLF